MERTPATLDQVQAALGDFGKGYTNHQEKKYKEAVEYFNNCSSVNPIDADHLPELQKKLKEGGYKLAQESLAYMGCAVKNLKVLIDELDAEDKDSLEIDKNLKEALDSWE